MPNEVEQRRLTPDEWERWLSWFADDVEPGTIGATAIARLRGHHAATEALLHDKEEEVRALRHLLNEIERGADDIREGLHGCGDHSCMVKKPLGMATNGGCRCVERNTFEVRVLIGRALRKAARLEEENRRLREALLMCKRRVQRLDELGVTRSDNWLLAIDNALRGEQS